MEDFLTSLLSTSYLPLVAAGFKMCSRWWHHYGWASYSRKLPKRCYPYFQFRDRLYSWDGKYQRRTYV